MSAAAFGAPEFKASSGRTVKFGQDGSLSIDHKRGYLSPDVVMDAEEFFQARRDAELGRWRDPVAPAVVATMRPDGIFVFDEVALEYSVFQRPLYGGHAVRTSTGDYRLGSTADRFFEAHPERKPWEDAKPGEVWELTSKDSTFPTAAFIVLTPDSHVPMDAPYFENTDYRYPLTSPEIIDGRRIWPEAAA